MIAALYVETGGAYYGLPDADAWGELTWARSPSEGRPRVGTLSLSTPLEFRNVLLGIARGCATADVAAPA